MTEIKTGITLGAVNADLRTGHDAKKSNQQISSGEQASQHELISLLALVKEHQQSDFAQNKLQSLKAQIQQDTYSINQNDMIQQIILEHMIQDETNA